MSRSNLSKEAIQKELDYSELELSIPGEVIYLPDGQFYKVNLNVHNICSDIDLIVKRYNNIFNDRSLARSIHSELMQIHMASLEEIVFVDIETTGFRNCPLFLIGLLYFDTAKGLSIEQLFARHYLEEASILEHFRNLITRFRIMVTFNGKTFDVPFIQSRMIYHGKFAERLPLHIDMLYHSRRRWRWLVPNCRLITLEEYICNRKRINDVPSKLIPHIYREFIRSGHIDPLKDVFQHNALDLVTLCDLTSILLLEEGRQDGYVKLH